MAMTKFWVDEDEWWPVYSLEKAIKPDNPNAIEMADADYADYVRVMEEFRSWQIRLKEIWKARR